MSAENLKKLVLVLMSVFVLLSVSFTCIILNTQDKKPFDYDLPAKDKPLPLDFPNRELYGWHE